MPKWSSEVVMSMVLSPSFHIGDSFQAFITFEFITITLVFFVLKLYLSRFESTATRFIMDWRLMALSDNKVISSAQVGADTSTDPILYPRPDVDSTSRRSLHLAFKSSVEGIPPWRTPCSSSMDRDRRLDHFDHLTSHAVIQAAV